jgi:ADP-ribose pyrophosphatase YjhB (NUDIX family)
VFLQACITAAVQLIHARNPAFTPARCWHTLFAKYCELWQQQHPLMGLWASPGGWVGAVRAGGLLTVLRGVTPAEALAQETRPSVLKHVMEVRWTGVDSLSNGHWVLFMFAVGHEVPTAALQSMLVLSCSHAL